MSLEQKLEWMRKREWLVGVHNNYHYKGVFIRSGCLHIHRPVVMSKVKAKRVIGMRLRGLQDILRGFSGVCVNNQH